jgi:hypothetical protein
VPQHDPATVVAAFGFVQGAGELLTQMVFKPDLFVHSVALAYRSEGQTLLRKRQSVGYPAFNCIISSFR